MNFKTLTITIVIAASLAALASMPLTATPVYAGGNVKTDQKTHVHNNDGDTTTSQNQECIVDNNCSTTTTTTTINNPPGETKCYEKKGNKLEPIACPT